MVVLTDERYEGLVKMADYHLPHKPNWDSDGDADGHPVYDAYCPKCGSELDEGDKFCHECGQRIDWSEDKEEK